MDRAKLVKEIRGWALTILAVLAFRTFLFEAVYIPSGSMIPTLQIGDYVVVQKWAYGARLPFTSTAQAMWSSPRRGDIVVLLAPEQNRRKDDLIKRVVAVGGDTVAIRSGHLSVNGTPVPREAVPDERCTYMTRSEDGPWEEERCADHLETLDGHRYHTYCEPSLDGHCGDDVNPFVVPEGTVFLAGDHRDKSFDSRYFGPVPVGRIKGRAWIALVSWGDKGLRWDRLFHFVNH
ncbi:MAG: signal peptidase I [Anaeromyxobacter sp.]